MTWAWKGGTVSHWWDDARHAACGMGSPLPDRILAREARRLSAKRAMGIECKSCRKTLAARAQRVVAVHERIRRARTRNPGRLHSYEIALLRTLEAGPRPTSELLQAWRLTGLAKRGLVGVTLGVAELSDAGREALRRLT